jgi:hypothetical protein
MAMEEKGKKKIGYLKILALPQEHWDHLSANFLTS